MLKKIVGVSLLALSFSGNLRAQEMVYPDTMVVLDVSNSMWGQIDGVSKMEIARGVIGELLTDLQTDSEFGLIAYGHRQASDCSDIELILPIGPLDGAAFSAAVDQLQPHGRTPLTAAVEMAAGLMDSDTRSARVILLTDGLESCDADPCALATALEETGLDFTTHVIGFGVSEIEDQSQISCLAENTGGVYLTAETAAELTSALEFMAMPMDVPQLTLRAVDTAGNVIENSAIEWSIFNMTDQEMWLRDEVGASISVEYQADDYRATAQIGDQIATLEFSFDGQESATFDVVLEEEGELPASVSVDAPAETAPGKPINVDWVGPENSGDYLAIALPDSPVTSFLDYARARAGSPAALTAPEENGIYEIRYISPTTNEILATDVMIVGEIEITLNSPAEVKAGAEISITWEGPLFDGDRLVLLPLDATEEDILSTVAANAEKSAILVAPNSEGEFEIQYQDIDGKVLKTAALSVAYDATIDTVSEAVAGSDIIVKWTGPDTDGDFITIVKLDSDNTVFGNFGLTRDGEQLKILTPDKSGDYEIRYVIGESQSIVTRQSLTLLQPEMSLDVVTEAFSGDEVEINWVGPNNQNDYLTIVPVNAEEGVSDNYSFARQGSPMTMQLPDERGDFEIRYVTGQSGLTLASVLISLAPEPTLLEAEASVVAGEVVTVKWQGPETEGDLITIVPVGTANNAFGNFTYTSEGAELGLITEAILGDFEIRYVSGTTDEILARLPIAQVAPPVVIEVQQSAVAGASVTIEWDGPDDDDDYITIVPLGSGDDQDGNYTYTRSGAPLDLITIDIAGDYEIRYVSGDSKATLARAEITLTAPESSVEAVSEAVAGTEIIVAWQGPDNQNDFVTVVPVGTETGQYGNYTYSRRGADLAVLTPDMPGEYEVRYVSGQSFGTLSSTPITLSAPAITIDASPVGVAGAFLEVVWTGPSNENDFLTVVPVGAEENALGAYQYTRKGNILELTLPEEAGAFEIRYVSGQSMRTLETLPLTILGQ